MRAKVCGKQSVLRKKQRSDPEGKKDHPRWVAINAGHTLLAELAPRETSSRSGRPQSGYKSAPNRFEPHSISQPSAVNDFGLAPGVCRLRQLMAAANDNLGKKNLTKSRQKHMACRAHGCRDPLQHARISFWHAHAPNDVICRSYSRLPRCGEHCRQGKHAHVHWYCTGHG